MSTAQLGALSTTFVYAAMAAYAIAFVAFAIDLSALGDRGPRGRRRRAVGIATATTTLGALFHLAGIVLRGAAAGRAPWANMYEFTLVFAFVAVAVFLIGNRLRDIRYLGALVTGPALLALGLAVAVLYVAADGVQPALQSYWLVIHVSVATASVGILSVAAAFSVLQLAVSGRTRGADDGDGPGVAADAPTGGRVAVTAPATTRTRAPRAIQRILSALPAAEELERLAYRLNAVGFVLWSFTLIAGAIWAEHAWGRYWGWDAKEVWTFVIWVVYAAYLHARSTRGWSGRRAAYFALFGYVCVLLNFFVVNLLFTSMHTYSGIQPPALTSGSHLALGRVRVVGVGILVRRAALTVRRTVLVGGAPGRTALRLPTAPVQLREERGVVVRGERAGGADGSALGAAARVPGTAPAAAALHEDDQDVDDRPDHDEQRDVAHVSRVLRRSGGRYGRGEAGS